MRLRNFHLYKLPIDNTYENVFDGWGHDSPTTQTAMISYGTTLRDLYDTDGIITDQITTAVYNKSVKISNGVSTITLPLSYEFVRNYNYIIINLSDVFSDTYPYYSLNIQAFFITSVVSENDSEINPSCTVTIEYDVWANNYYNLLHENNNKCNIEEGHINRISEIQNSSVKMRTIPITGNRSEPTTYTTYASFVKDDDNLPSKNNFRMLWVAIELDDDANFSIYKPASNSYAEVAEVNAKTDYGIFRYLFVPYRWVKDDGEAVSSFIQYTYSTGAIYPETIKHITDIYDGIEDLRTHIKNLYFTYTPPFDFKCYDFNTAPFVVIESSSAKTLVGHLGSSPSAVSVYGGFVYTEIVEKKHFTTDDIKLNRDTLGVQYFIQEYSQNTGAVNSEIPYNNYPYCYASANIGSSKLPLYSYYTFSKVELEITPFVYGNNINAKYLIGDNVVDVNNTTIENNGYIPFTYELSQEYWRQNGAKIGYSLLSSGIKDLALLFAGMSTSSIGQTEALVPSGTYSNAFNPQTVVNFGQTSGDFITQARNLKLTMADLKNSRDTVNNYQSTGQLNYFRLDRPLVSVTNIVLTEDFLVDYYSTLSRGYIYSRFGNAIENSRMSFDFVKSSNFRAISITNIKERNTIERILYLGVRKWHINNFTNDIYTQGQKERLTKLDYTVINPEPELVPYFTTTTEE